jgi:cytochrome c oxidase subunit I+III
MHLTGMRGMPRRVYTYPADIGLDTLNMVSTIGAFILAAGLAVLCWDVVRPKKNQPYAPRNPWGAGTLEWLQEMPGKPWGIRSIPEIDSRYPLWDQPNFLRDVDEGRFYLPDAEEGLRETIVTSVIDAEPVQVQRLSGPSFIPMTAALTLGGFFIFGTFHLWLLAMASLLVATGVIAYWLWGGTGGRPEKDEKDVGLGLSLPLYASGSASVGWWGVFITMLADVTAYVCLVFGYFFFWTVHDDFPPSGAADPGVLWPAVGAAMLCASWALIVLVRRWNARDRGGQFYLGLAAAAALATGGGVALLAGPWTAGLDPTAHAYGAIVWLLMLWTVVHVAVGLVMLAYCALRRAEGRMTARHDIDVHNVVLYWHFTVLTALVTALVVAGFPRVS